MLTLYHSRVGRGERPANLAAESLPKNVAWIDLLNPEPDEVAFVKRLTGINVPSVEDLSEIESSSRAEQSVWHDLSECAAGLSDAAAALRRRSRLRRFYPLTLHGCL